MVGRLAARTLGSVTMGWSLGCACVTPGSSRAFLGCHQRARASRGSGELRMRRARGSSQRRLQHGGACCGSHHSCSAATASRGRLRPLPVPPGGGYENPGHRRAHGGFGENGAGAAGPVTLLSFPFQAPSVVIHRDSGSQQQGESGCDALVTVINAVLVN